MKRDALAPAAVDLEALVVEGLHRELHGVASLLAGPYSEDNWRSKVRGEKPLSLGDLCSLATSPTREAHAAALAAVTALAGAIGCRVEAVVRPAGGDLVDAAADMAGEATRTLGDVARALKDGQVDVVEAAALRARAAKLIEAAAVIERLVLSGTVRTTFTEHRR